MSRSPIGPAGASWHVGRRGTWIPSTVVLAAVVAGAVAQYPVQQDGRLFDASPQLGAGRYNYGRPVSPLMLGNAVVSGYVRGGLAFQGRSTIPGALDFRGPLGSGTLSGFERDSVSVADTASPYGIVPGTPYFDPARTVYTPGFLSGQSSYLSPRVGPQPPTPTLPRRAEGVAGLRGPLDLRLDTLSYGPGLAVGPSDVSALRSQIAGLTPGPRAGADLSSSLFGPMPTPTPEPGGAFQKPGALDRRLANLTKLPGQEARPLGRLGAPGEPPPEEPPGSRPPLGTPEEFVRRGELARMPLDNRIDPFAPRRAADEQFVLGPVKRPEEPAAQEAARANLAGAAATPSVPRLRDTSMLPGQDVFTDMQLALSLAANPKANWYGDMQEAARQSPRVSPRVRELAALQSDEFVHQVLAASIRTFHGEGESAVNNELLKAESLLEIGQYYEAARRYQAANRLDPLNPLPLIGLGNAYLAAGEYLSAAVALAQGLQRYPELSRFRFDLKALMGGGEIVDIRRADLMHRLQDRDDAKLRFLLGYLEYYGADPDSGLQNLEQAADLDLTGSIISQFPRMLRDQGALPPPKLPGQTPLLPETPPAREDRPHEGP